MMNALFTGISGLRSHQVRMDVTGNNIANVNTTAFKRGRALFAEMLAGQGAGSGGVTANVGKGVTVQSIDRNWQQGSFEITGFASDLALGGDGFFVVSAGSGPMLTRAGSFRFDGQGRFVTPGGQRVQGFPVNPDGTSYVGALQDIRLDLNANSPPRETNRVGLNGNLSANAEVGGATGNVSVSSVVYDSQGIAHTIVLTLEKTAVNQWTVTNAELAGDPDATPPVPPTPLAGVGDVLEFDTAGRLVAPDPAASAFTGLYPFSGDDLDIRVDLSGITQFGGSTTLAATEQNGQAAGEVIGYGFDQRGMLVLSFSNGEQRAVAQLAIGSVNNPGGLDQLGDGFFGATQLSGDLKIGRAGQEVNTSVTAGALEASNVDLATEFTDLIVNQRGYQASARVITTADELLQELVMLKR